jgi:hypothetical protein
VATHAFTSESENSIKETVAYKIPVKRNYDFQKIKEPFKVKFTVYFKFKPYWQYSPSYGIGHTQIEYPAETWLQVPETHVFELQFIPLD